MNYNIIIALITLIGLLSSFSAANALEYNVCFHKGDSLGERSVITNNSVNKSKEQLSWGYSIYPYQAQNIFFYRSGKSFIYSDLYDNLVNGGYINCTQNATTISNVGGNYTVTTVKYGAFLKDTFLTFDYDQYRGQNPYFL